MKCNICDSESKPLFEDLVLRKHKVRYFRCETCGFIQTEKPYWLGEAYKSAINTCDTGLLGRNIRFSAMAALLIFYFFDRAGAYVDYAGGYGVFTRLMRDMGFDFYWTDPYCQNLFARGFEYDPAKGRPAGKSVGLVTAFESFEHFADPRAELDAMLSISKNVLFSTDLVPEPVPKPGEWWYYAPEHGQHVSFYTPKALERLAADRGLRYYTDGKRLHLFTDRELPRWFGMPFSFELLGRMRKARLPLVAAKRSLVSKTDSDSKAML